MLRACTKLAKLWTALQAKDVDNSVILQEEVISDPPARQANELVIGVLMRPCKAVLGPGWRPASSAYEALGLSARTMQRRLDASGMVFSDLVNEVPTELVQRYLDNPRHSMVAISQMLGYSAPSAFTRWFSGQFGMAPQRWRERVVSAKSRG